MLTNSNSAQGDQLAFLQLGLDMREHGVLTDGTRNPLYAAFLALIAHRDWAYFTYAKLFSLTFGILAIIALFWLGWRFFDHFTGLVAAYLLSINVEFIVHSATALTESLLVLTFILAWFAMLKALDYPDQSRYWAGAGLLAGLAYEAKGSGQLLVLAFLAISFLFYRWSLLRSKSLWLFLGCYALIASPLWLYNTSHFGTPTFNYAISHQMWMDSWNDWHPDDLDNLPTLRSYWQSHSPAEIWERQWNGLKAMRNILVKTLWPTRTLTVDEFLLSPFSTYVLAALAILPLLFWPFSRQYIHQNRSTVYLTGLATFIFFMLFAWYDAIVALGQRFLLPIIPWLYILFAHILGRVSHRLMVRGSWPRRFILLAAATIFIYQLYWAIRTNLDPTQVFFTQDVFAQDRQFNADAATPLAWLANQTPKPVVVAWGPSGNSLPTWAFSDRLDVRLYPPHIKTIPELTQNLVNRTIGFIIVDADMVSRHRSLLKEQFPSDGARVDMTGIPPGWAFTYAYRSLPCDWCIFRLLADNPPQYQANYQIGGSILLVGYDLHAANSRPGDTLYLTLHWTTQVPIERPYTVFTQLLGPDFQLHGQMDHQPLNNLWPTTRWQPGSYLADRYDILIAPTAPPGEYQVLVGMYDSQTGQRQAVSQNGQPVPDNAIRLTTITLASK
jgi:4-amino-4-deoxy-L-arabinose transferase-like glycosyltransferase